MANDYLLSIYAKIDIPGALNNEHYISVKPNFSPITNSSGFYYYLGFKAAMFSILRCHSDCSTCSGPLATQCLTCQDSAKTIVNSTCVCNTAANYFYIANS